MKLKAKYDLTDIWRIRNPTVKRYTFRMQHYTRSLQLRLYFIFVSNNMQTQVKSVDIDTSIATDHSPVTMSVRDNDALTKGQGLWKFNTSLIDDVNFVSGMVKVIEDTVRSQINSREKQLNWEILKYEIRKFVMAY